MTPDQITETLRLHAAWLRGDAAGKRAHLGDAYLRGADLRDADLESARLPEGWGWWQGGAYGPRRRMIRAVRTPDGVTVMAGCISGPPDDVHRQLADARHPIWVDEIGRDAADRALRQALALIDLAVETLTEEQDR